MIERLEEINIYQNQFAWFDLESFEECSSYVNLFEELMKISKLQFQNIIWREGWSQEKEHYLAEVTFSYKSHKYIIKVLCEEWFDPDLIIELNLILNKDSSNERFYFIETNDQSIIVAFLDNYKNAILQKNNLIVNFSNLKLEKNQNWNQLMIT